MKLARSYDEDRMVKYLVNFRSHYVFDTKERLLQPMLYITVALYGKQKIKGEFREYEVKALNIFKKYGGQVIAAYVPVHDGRSEEMPDEIQVLRIASYAEFENFMNDPDRRKMTNERSQVIAKTDVYVSDEMVEYS
jgi:uncharacterized protein (DUF1330 family)